MNQGLVFYHPNESVYNKYRRLVVANPILRSTFNKINKSALVNFLIQETHNTSVKYPHTSPNALGVDDLQEFMNQTLYCRRQCPDCAKIIFHSSLFDCDWIKLCPVHQKALVDCCPECKHPWPNSKEIAERTCPCCGSTPENSVYALRKETQPLLIDKFGQLKRVIEKFNRSPVYTLYSRYNHFSRVSISAEHKIVFAFLREAGMIDDAVLNALNVESEEYEVRTKKFFAKKIDLNSPAHPMHPLSSDTLHFIRLAKMNEIVVFLVSLNKCSHDLHEASFFYDLEPSCPHCYAFGIWYKLVFCNFLADLSDKSSIQIPQPCCYLVNDALIELPEDIQAIIYEKDLEMSFLVIYRHVLDWMKTKSNRNGMHVVDRLTETYLRDENNFFTYFWFQVEDSNASLYYSDKPILAESNFNLHANEEYPCSFDKNEYSSPKILNMYNLVWLLGTERRILDGYTDESQKRKKWVFDPTIHFEWLRR